MATAAADDANSHFHSDILANPQALEQARMPSSHTSREQVSAIIALYKSHRSSKNIADQLHLNKRTVNRIIARFREEGEVALPAPRPRSGRPSKVSKATRRIISRQVTANPRLTARQLKENNPQLLGQVTIRCIQNILRNDLGYRSFKARRKPMLSFRQRQNRIKFCKKYQHWTQEDWKKVLWSDEATFTVTGCGVDRVWRKPSDNPLETRFTCKTTKHPDSVMVWGSFGYHGVGELVVLPKNEKMNQNNYLELLCDYLPDSMEKTNTSVFMQDGAPCHTAKSVKMWLDDCEINYFKDWPGNSPDINPIENMWGLMKRRLQHVATSSVPALIDAIRKVWDEFPADNLQAYANSLPKRLKEVIKAKGYPVNY